MTLCNLSEALRHAEQERYAIGSFNLASEDMFHGILDAAEQEHAPVIVSIAEAHLPYLRWPSFMRMVCAEAERAAVPVVIHLDHACQFATIYKALTFGFTSVMYDGSMLSFAENIANTQRVVELAHTLGISVEAELGHVGGTSNEVGVPHETKAHLTDPLLVPEFVEKTGVDALAVAFGTAHGFYVSEPVLNYYLLSEIHSMVETPLVLHGGTGLSDVAFTRTIHLGIRKINYGTDMFASAVSAARKTLAEDPDLINYAVICQQVQGAVRDRVARYIRLWGGAGKSWIQ